MLKATNFFNYSVKTGQLSLILTNLSVNHISNRSLSSSSSSPLADNPADRIKYVKRGSTYQAIDLDAMENDSFEEYLKAQEMIKDSEEWEHFRRTLRRRLPTTIRVNKSPFNHHIALQNYLEQKAGKFWIGNYDEGNKCIKNINWYPEQLAYAFERDNSFKGKLFGWFAKCERFCGAIYFQEAVSMIPILLLNPQPDHSLLDLCASPGSKTTQALQHITNSCQQSTNYETEGVLIANDLETRRCAKLLSQAKLLCYPQLILTKGNAVYFPPIQDDFSKICFNFKFDRVLCDVPCSGDGTIRKNPHIWSIWDPSYFRRFHEIQLKIAQRGITQVKKGGLMVYSTCSMNPVENEAIISQLISSSNGSLELVDCHNLLGSSFKCIPGLKKWKIMQPDGSLVSTYNEVTDHEAVLSTMFPSESMNKINIERCLRILPHHLNSGGFFVGLIRKLDSVPWENELPYRRQDSKSVKLEFLDSESADWLEIKKTFRLKDGFPVDQLVHQYGSEAYKRIHYVSKSAKHLILSNLDKLNFVRVGVGLFERMRVSNESVYRLTIEGIPIVLPYLPDDLIIDLDLQRFVELILCPPKVQILHEKEFIDLNSGPYISRCIMKEKRNGIETNVTLAVPILKTSEWVYRFISAAERLHLLRISGFLDETDISSHNNLTSIEDSEHEL